MKAPPRTLLAVALVMFLVIAGCSDGEHGGTSGAVRPVTAAPSGDVVESDGPPQTRTYYVAADPVRWDYAPDGQNQITAADFDEDAEVFVGREGRIGSVYDKCLFRSYTDDSFGVPTERAPADSYLGDLGPTLRAEVGDTIAVVFRNNCSFPTSMHPHGVLYEKDSEGAGYADDSGDAAHADDAVAPGGTHTYTWQVPERAGPGPMDGSSAVWMYHSHADEIGDVYAGLSGFLVITARGKAEADGSPRDVDHEVFSMFLVDDENSSPLLESNLRHISGAAPDVEDEDFVESNLMHAINGYVYGNGPVLELRKGERVRWYLMAMGTEVDLHTPHWHGNTATVNGMRTDVVNLLPATMLVADMTPDTEGTWLFHCHVADHIAAGMQTRYRVTAPGSPG